MKPCISTTICLLDAPNTDCQYVETVVGFAQKHDLMWELISILNLWDNLFKSLVNMSNKRNLLMIPSFNRIIRFFLYVQIPTEAGNDMVKNPSLLRNIEEYINYVKAEGAYFGPSNGSRTMFFVVNMDSADMIPKIIEPLFQKFRARVEMHPIMVLDDLKKAFS